MTEMENSKLDSSQKIKNLLQCLENDVTAADAKWSLFIAACQSYKYDSCLRPFPPTFMKNEKDINSLLEVVDRTPSFALFKSVLSSNKSSLIPDVIDLVHWVLIQSKGPSFKSIAKNQFDSIISKVPCDLPAKRPSYIYEVVYPENSALSIKWNNFKEEHGSLYAYHGSKLENFYSIVNCGLLISLTKTALFGPGVYLSSELLVSLPYSSNGFGWGKSMMGGELSVVALCEVIDHPSIHCQMKFRVLFGHSAEFLKMAECRKCTPTLKSFALRVGLPQTWPNMYCGTAVPVGPSLRKPNTEGETAVTSSYGDKPRALASDSIGGEVPHKYYVVTNSDLIRLRYLFFYTRSAPKPECSEKIKQESWFSWIGQHKLLAGIFGYIILLASLGLSNNQNVMRYYRMFLNKAGLLS